MGFKRPSYGAFRRFGHDRRGGLPTQVALAMGAAGVIGALVVAPMLEGAVNRQAASGIDRTVTGAVSGKPQRLVIRQSVLSDNAQVTCTGGGKKPCGN